MSENKPFPADAYTIVAVNGAYAPELSSKEELPFSVYADGTFNVEIAAGKRLAKPIHIISIVKPEERKLSLNPRTQITVGKGSSATIIESHLSLEGSEYCENRVSRLHVKDGARADCHRYFDVSGASCIIEDRCASVEAGGHLCDYFYAGRAGVMKYRSDTRLGRGAYAGTNAAVLADGDADVAMECRAYPTAPDTKAENRLAAVAAGRARVEFATSVFAASGAEGSSAEQWARVMLASPEARARIKPMQSVGAEGIGARHGAAVGGASEDEVFFLESRGLSEAQAEELVQKSLLWGMFASIGDEAIRGAFEKIIWGNYP